MKRLLTAFCQTRDESKRTSMPQEKKLPTERAQKEGGSVYDFLYADHERIAVLHSQFNEFGHLTRLVKQATVANEVGGGGLPTSKKRSVARTR